MTAGKIRQCAGRDMQIKRYRKRWSKHIKGIVNDFGDLAPILAELTECYNGKFVQHLDAKPAAVRQDSPSPIGFGTGLLCIDKNIGVEESCHSSLASSRSKR